MRKLVEWRVDTHVQLPDSSTIRSRAVGDQDLLSAKIAQAYQDCGLAKIVGDEGDVPKVHLGENL